MEKKSKLAAEAKKSTRHEHYKIRFTMRMDLNGNISSTSSKGPNKIVKQEDVAYFLKHAREHLDDLEKRWGKLYLPPEEEKPNRHGIPTGKIKTVRQKKSQNLQDS